MYSIMDNNNNNNNLAFCPKQVGVGISIRVAKFLRWLAKPTTTLLLYQGLGPAMLGHLGTPP
jgi:hypothetical protein